VCQIIQYVFIVFTTLYTNYTLAGYLLWEECYINTTIADQDQEDHPGHQTTDHNTHRL